MKCGDIVVYNGKIGKVVSDYKNKEIMRFLPCNYGRYSSSTLDIITESSIREATHEEKLTLIKKEYSWGNVIAIHCIGEYQIVEAIREGQVHWHGYIDYEDTHVSYFSLDAALIGCIGKKYEGSNGKAAMYFCKMVGMDKEFTVSKVDSYNRVYTVDIDGTEHTISVKELKLGQ